MAAGWKGESSGSVAMDLMNTPLFAGLANRLHFLSARTNVLAENIANADTPGYVARDVSAPDFSKLAHAETLKTTNARHIQTASSQSAPRPHPAPDGEASLNGNEVSVETQMMKLSETRMNYQLAATVYRKGLDLIRLAARGSK